MSTLTVRTIDRNGLSITDYLQATTGADKFANTGNELFIIKNAGVSSRTVTLVTQGTVDGLTTTGRSVVIPSGKEYIIGPFPTRQYSDSDKYMNLTYSGGAATGLSCLACSV